MDSGSSSSSSLVWGKTTAHDIRAFLDPGHADPSTRCSLARTHFADASPTRMRTLLGGIADMAGKTPPGSRIMLRSAGWKPGQDGSLEWGRRPLRETLDVTARITCRGSFSRELEKKMMVPCCATGGRTRVGNETPRAWDGNLGPRHAALLRLGGFMAWGAVGERERESVLRVAARREVWYWRLAVM